MTSVGKLPAEEQGTAPAVRTCYDLLTVLPICGVTDFTDGKYLDDRSPRRYRAAYLAAQERQAEYLLNEVRCGAGTRLLDIGCGYGRILEHAARRGAKPIGITISPAQVASGRARGLDVRELNYRDIFKGVGWAPPTNEARTKMVGDAHPTSEHAFDAIVANGSLEHFVQVADAVAGRSDTIYAEMFAICRRLLTGSGRLVTTAIHFRETNQFDAAQIARGSGAQPRGSDGYQFAMLAEWFGGWYPEPGQLQRCARPYFELIHEEDGTHDYHITSEYWLRRCQRSLAYNPRVWWAVARQFVYRSRAAWQMMRLQLWDQSWVWQFRPPAPMRLLRQTWQTR